MKRTPKADMRTFSGVENCCRIPPRERGVEAVA